MNQNYNQPPRDNSGMGVILGILIAVLIAVGGYFFFQSQNAGNNTLEPAAGIEAPGTPAPDAGDVAPAPTAPEPAPAL